MFDPDQRPQLPVEISGSVIYNPRPRKRVAGDTYLPDDRLNRPDDWRQKVKFLDSNRGRAIHANLMGHYTREIDRQADNRLEMATDEDFYDHNHWTAEEIEILQARGQLPITYNLTQTTVNWVLGTQRRAPMDYRVLAKNKDGVKAAERKTQLLKHVSDANHFDHEISTAFASSVKAGLGWLESAQGSYDDNSKVLARAESWRSMLWDSTAVRTDLDDARYISRAKWLDADVAMSLWQNRKGIVEASLSSTRGGVYALDELGDDPMDEQEMDHFYSSGSPSRANFTGERERIRVIEMWFKALVNDAHTIRGGQFHGELFDPWSIGHVTELNEGRAFLSTRPRMVIHCALMTDVGLLDLRRSPYRHNRYPFTPIWGYRRSRDGLPYGLIRGIRDINRDFNARAAKALHHLSTTRVFVEEGAVDDIEELRDEAARPDAVIKYKAGRAAPTVATDRAVADAHVNLMAQDASLIQQVGGVTDENLGRKTNAASGKAILARQDQGQLATSLFFDNLRYARIIHGEKEMILIEQFYTAADEIRTVDQRGNPEFVAINNGDPGNAIARFKADFALSEEDWRATYRQAQAEQLLDLAQKLAATAPQAVIRMLDLLVEALDVPKKDELVKRIRQITGVEDPDADPNNPSPEQIARQEEQKKQAALAERATNAELAEKEAKARKVLAEAAKTEQDVSKNVIGQLQDAIKAAIELAGAPAVASAADQILAEAKAIAAGAEQNPTPAAQPQSITA